MTTLPFPIVQLRLRQAAEIADRGGALKDVAQAWQIGLGATRAWLRQRDPALFARLAQDRSGPPGYSSADALERLRAIRDARAAGRLGKQIAHDLGYAAASGVAEFVTRCAPDGIDAAIADLQRHLNSPTLESPSATAPGNGRTNKNALTSGSNGRAGESRERQTPPSASSPDIIIERKSA